MTSNPFTSVSRPAIWLIIALAITILASGCATKQRVHPPPPRPVPSTPVPTPPPEIPPEAETPSVEIPPVETLPPPPPTYVPRTGPAKGLYGEAEKALAANQPGKAEMLIERALRIEPRNAHYWYTLARIKYQQTQYPQTIQFCLKSNSLAAGQPQLTERNNQLLHQAKAKVGK